MQRATGSCATRVISSLLTQQADSGDSLTRPRTALCAASEKVVVKGTVKQLGVLESDQLVVLWRSAE